MKIGDKTFEFILPTIALDKPAFELLNDWRKLIINQQNSKEDTWTILPGLPQYEFKNLRIESSFDDADRLNETTITLKYDDFKFDKK